VPSKLTVESCAPRNIQDNEEIAFKIKKSTKLLKVYILYAQRKNVELDSMRFLFDGDRVHGSQTAKMAGLEDQDELLCVLETVRACMDAVFVASFWIMFLFLARVDSEVVLSGTSLNLMRLACLDVIAAYS
jgi:Ubiquitin-2 like Rad60 SUMO-like